jgi:hypothetical protein
MPWEPETTNLNTLDEFKNLFHTIKYYGYLGSVATYYPVTIEAVDENITINVSGDTISGYYSDAFDNDIYYRNKDDTFTTVTKFEQIDTEKNYDGIYHYDADMNRTKIFNYIASSNGETKNYTITVTNNWTNGRNQLVKFNNPGAYAEVTCTWTNTLGSGIPWTNTTGQTITWENNTWV